jgi:hypothetical protein
MNDPYAYRHLEQGNEIVPTSSLKRRKLDEDAVASVLLSLDGRSPPKRYRSTTPLIDSREMSNTSAHQSPEQRQHEETSTRDDSSPSSSSKLSRRFMARFEGNHHSGETSLKNGETADSRDLASAMALTSLANQLPTQGSPTSHVKYQKQTMDYNGYHVNSQRQPPYAVQMSNIGMPSFQGPPMCRDYYNNSPRNYNPSSTYAHHNQAPQQWACDFCNRASFSTFDEASNHEKDCNYNPEILPRTSLKVPPKESSRSISMTSVVSSELKHSILTSDTKFVSSPGDEDETNFFCGTIPLAVPLADPEWLSEMNCYIRKECILAFSADTCKLFLLIKFVIYFGTQ